MWRWVLVTGHAGALASLTVGCGGAAHTPRVAVLGEKVTRAPVGCDGWFLTSGSTVQATVAYAGPVVAVTARAVLADAADPPVSGRVVVPAGSTDTVVRIRHVTGVVSAVTATVSTAAGATATCALANPH